MQEYPCSLSPIKHISADSVYACRGALHINYDYVKRVVWYIYMLIAQRPTLIMYSLTSVITVYSFELNWVRCESTFERWQRWTACCITMRLCGCHACYVWINYVVHKEWPYADVGFSPVDNINMIYIKI